MEEKKEIREAKRKNEKGKGCGHANFWFKSFGFRLVMVVENIGGKVTNHRIYLYFASCLNGFLLFLFFPLLSSFLYCVVFGARVCGHAPVYACVCEGVSGSRMQNG